VAKHGRAAEAERSARNDRHCGAARLSICSRTDIIRTGAPGREWASNGLVKFPLVTRHSSRLLIFAQETLAQFDPTARNRSPGGIQPRHGPGRVSRCRSPIHGDLLPERDMPEFLIDRVRSPFNCSISDFAFQPVENVGRGRGALSPMRASLVRSPSHPPFR